MKMPTKCPYYENLCKREHPFRVRDVIYCCSGYEKCMAYQDINVSLKALLHENPEHLHEISDFINGEFDLT